MQILCLKALFNPYIDIQSTVSHGGLLLSHNVLWRNKMGKEGARELRELQNMSKVCDHIKLYSAFIVKLN